MKKLLISLTVVLCLFGTFNLASAEERFCVSGGSGIQYWMHDNIGFGVPLLIGFQFAVIEKLTIEVDFQWTFYLGGGSDFVDDADHDLVQIGPSVRYWFSRAFDGFYAGGGIAYTYWKYDPDWDPWGNREYEDEYATLVLKGGYALKISDMFGIDFGIRYDVINLEFDESPIGFTVQFMFKF